MRNGFTSLLDCSSGIWTETGRLRSSQLRTPLSSTSWSDCGFTIAHVSSISPGKAWAFWKTGEHRKYPGIFPTSSSETLITTDGMRSSWLPFQRAFSEAAHRVHSSCMNSSEQTPVGVLANGFKIPTASRPAIIGSHWKMPIPLLERGFWPVLRLPAFDLLNSA